MSYFQVDGITYEDSPMGRAELGLDLARAALDRLWQKERAQHPGWTVDQLFELESIQQAFRDEQYAEHLHLRAVEDEAGWPHLPIMS